MVVNAVAKTARKRRYKQGPRPENVRWAGSKPGKSVSVAHQLLVELNSNYYRQGVLLREKVDKEDAKRIESELIFIKGTAAVLEMAQWRVIDIIVTLGIAEFMKKHWHKVMFMAEHNLERETKRKEAFDILDKDVNLYSQYLEKTGNELTDEAFVNYADHKRKDIIDAQKGRK